MTIWYMPLGCVALSADTDWASRRLQDFRVQPLCAHHTNRQDPHEQPSRDVPFDRALVASVPSELLRGSHLLVDLTVGNSSSYPQSTWAASGPHWSDTAGEGGAPLPPALELGYDMDALREFAGTDLGRLVFSGYTRLLG